MKYNSFFILKATMLLILSFFCVTTYAKPEKIKYGKHILYVGETIKLQGEKVPYGQGVLTLFEKDKDDPTINIVGEFRPNDQNSKGMLIIENASMRSTYIGVRSFSGKISCSIEADKNNSNVSLLFDGAINHSPILVAGKGISEIGVNELCLKLSYDKEQKAWNAQLENPNCEILDQRIPAVLSNLNYAESDIQTVISEVTYSNGEITFDNPTFKLKDGGSFSNNKLTFSDGSYYVINGNKWHGSKKFADGVLTKNENSEDCHISYNNGNTYDGTIKAKLVNLVRAKEIKETEYVDGVLTSNGTSEKWINGESFTKRHERLSGFLDADLVAAVEDGSLSESAATQKQEELNRQREEAKKKANVEELLQEWFGNSNTVTFKAKAIGKPTKESLGGFRELGLKVGDIVYDCTLVLRKDNTGTVTYRLSPSEQTTADQTIHYKNNGAKIRHGAYVAEFCNTINGSAEPESGEWSIDGGVLKFKKWNFEISEDHKKITWKFLEYITLELTGKSTTNLQPQKVAPYPKTLVGKQYEGVVHMGNLDPSLIKIHMSVKFLDSRQLKMHVSLKPMNDDGMKMLLEMFEPGVTEQDTIFHYTYQNGVVKIKDSTDKLTLRKNNTELYWYVNDDYNGSLYLKK